MKARIMIVAMMICLVPLSNALSQDTKAQDTKAQDTSKAQDTKAQAPAAQDNMTIEGELNLTGFWYNNGTEREGGEAKATEYKDLREPGGLYGSARLKLDTDKYFLNFDAGDFGYHTQYYQLEGGMWGKFKLNLFYDEIPHNITFDARTPFFGAGGDTLVGVPNTNFPGWNPFDYSIVRHQYGGGFKVDVLRPFFFDVSFARENRKGIQPVGAAETTPGGRAFELPDPVDYVTNNLIVSAGYTKKPLFLSLNYLYSNFTNDNTALALPANFNAPNAISLPPDNIFQGGTFKGALSLPFNSRFSTNAGFSRGESEISLFPTFNGKVDTQNYDFALTSNPVRFFDAKVYYKFYKRDNRSEDPLGLVEGFLDYKIRKYGADLGFRLPAKFYLTGGYQYVETKRQFHADPNDALPFNRDNIYSVDLKWSGLDFLEARVGYERLDRDAHYRTPQTAVNPSKMFSYAAQDRDTVKAILDIFPLENLNIGLEYRFINAHYPAIIFGLRNENGNEVEASADYSIGKIAKLYAYGDFEWIIFRQMQIDNSARAWEADQRDASWGYGIGAEVYVIPKKLTLIFQHDYLRSNGNVDFTLSPGMFGTGGLPAFPAANQDNIDIPRWDDYTLYSFTIKAVYSITKHFDASLGYAFESFQYNDAQLDNYRFAPTGAASNSAFLTGAYKDQSYHAHLVFTGLTYKF